MLASCFFGFGGDSKPCSARCRAEQGHAPEPLEELVNVVAAQEQPRLPAGPVLAPKKESFAVLAGADLTKDGLHNRFAAGVVRSAGLGAQPARHPLPRGRVTSKLLGGRGGVWPGLSRPTAISVSVPPSACRWAAAVRLPSLPRCSIRRRPGPCCGARPVLVAAWSSIGERLGTSLAQLVTSATTTIWSVSSTTA